MWEMTNKSYGIKENERLEREKAVPLLLWKSLDQYQYKISKASCADKCPNRPGNEHKLAGFYKRLKTT